MTALLVLALVAAVVVAMERTDRRARVDHRLPQISDRDVDRVRADLAAQEPSAIADQDLAARHVGHTHLRIAAFR